MDIVIQVSAVILGILGLIGSIVPVLPGPPLSFLGLILLFFKSDGTMKWSFLLLWGIITVVVTVLDYLVPAYFTKLTGGSRAATRFALAGMLLVSFSSSVGMIAGAFLGALSGEMLYSRRNGDLSGSLWPAFGSFSVFFGTGMKLVSSGIMIYYIIRYL